MSPFVKIALIFLLSSTKFMLAFPYAISGKISPTNTFFITFLGGVFGVYFYFYVFKSITDFIYRRYGKKKKLTGLKVTKKKRFLFKMKKRYGAVGIAILSPVLISIPLGCFILVKFFGKEKKYVFYLIGAVFFWSALFSFSYETIGSFF